MGINSPSSLPLSPDLLLVTLTIKARWWRACVYTGQVSRTEKSGSKGEDRKYLIHELNSHLYKTHASESYFLANLPCGLFMTSADNKSTRTSYLSACDTDNCTCWTENVLMPFPLEDFPGKVWQALFFMFLIVEIVFYFSLWEFWNTHTHTNIYI